MATQYLIVSPEQYGEHHSAMSYFKNKADYDSAVSAIQQLQDSGYVNQPWEIQKQFLLAKNPRLGLLSNKYNNVDELSQALQLSQTVKQRPGKEEPKVVTTNDIETKGSTINYLNYFKKGGIYIKPENRGKFTETKKRTGKTTEELAHSKNPLTRKRAIFALNARKWKHK